jgi:hypothetical protein
MFNPNGPRKRWTGPERWGIGLAAASLIAGMISAVGPFLK